MNCRSCKKDNLKLILDLTDQAWGNDFIPIDQNRRSLNYPLQLYFCQNCSMVQLGHTVPKETMFVDHAYLSGTTQSLKKHFVEIGEEILLREPLKKNDLVLDIGGNDGTFLKFFHDKDIRTLNIDSGKIQAEKCRENGIECLNTFFNTSSAKQILEQYGPAKIIHGSGILFHLEELHSAFEGIRDILATDGVLVAEFIYLPEMVKNCAYDQIYHEHLLYYSLHSFSRLLEQFNLEFHDAYLAPIHGGSCIAFISAKGTRTKSTRLLEMTALEEREGFDKFEVYAEFAKKVNQAKHDLNSMIKKFKSEGASIQALGAPVKGSTLINYCGLTHNELDCAVEINDYKCNTYYPGTQIPVYHERDVKVPDVYLLLSWNFKDEILARMKSFFNSGGKVIVPIPTPYVVENII